jgi:chromosome partitioning protein
VLEGRSVFQAGRRGEAAANEIQDLITEIFEHE